jgi:DNA polymerase-3 subunit beta
VQALNSVLLIAEYDRVELRASNIKTSITCKAPGIEVVEPGIALLPIKGVSDLFSKASSDNFSVSIDNGKAAMNSGRNKYRFATYPADQFPKLPTSEGGKLLCTAKSDLLSSTIERGTLCASAKPQFPEYLSSASFELKGGQLSVVSTDKRSLAIAKLDVTDASEDSSMLLPMSGIAETQRLLRSLPSDIDVKIINDDVQAYFVTDETEIAVRQVESKFPSYGKILPQGTCTKIEIDQTELISALERIDIVTRDFNRMLVIDLFEDGICALFGKSPTFGEAAEQINCGSLTGERLKSSFNSKYFLDAIKTAEGPSIRLEWEEPTGSVIIGSRDLDTFTALIAPMETDQNILAAYASEVSEG